MTKKKKKIWMDRLRGFVAGAILISLVGLGGIAVATDIFSIKIGLEDRTADILEGVLQLEASAEAGVFGGYTAGYWDSADGYYVDGTAIIDGDGNVDGVITSTTGTFSSVVTVDANRSGGGALDFGFRTNEGGQNATATAANVCDYAIWTIQMDADITMGLPDATSTIADCITSIGSCTQVKFYNNSTTSGADVSLIAIDNRYNTGSGSSGGTLLFAATSTDSGGQVLVRQGQMNVLEFCNLDAATSTVTSIEMVRDTTN